MQFPLTMQNTLPAIKDDELASKALFALLLLNAGQ
jgi:hypothetical protein